MADRQAVSEAELAALDAQLARTFGRDVAEAAGPLPLRTGTPGVLTEAEHDDKSGLIFGRFTGAQERDARRRVEEAQRQIAAERAVLAQVALSGWPAVLAAATGADRKLAESVKSRTGGKSAAELLENGRERPWGS